MPQGYADDMEGHMIAIGYTCPAVSGNVKCQRGGELEMLRKLPQMAIDALRTVAILRPLCSILPFDKRQEVLCMGIGILVEDTLYVWHNADTYLLPCLAAGIDYYSFSNVRFTQECKVDR